MTGNRSLRGMFAAFGLIAAIMCMPASASSMAMPPGWPTELQWNGVYKDNSLLQDPNGDTNGSRNIVSDSTHWAAMVFYDGTYFYCRLRLDDDPTGSGGQGLLAPYGWGVEFDTNGNTDDFEWLTILDGISQTESIRLLQNTVQGSIGDPGDQLEAEYLPALGLDGNYYIHPADTYFNPSGKSDGQDYWLEWRFPYDVLTNALGISASTPIRLFFGSSSSANTLSENGADLCGGSGKMTLAEGFSDYILLDSGRSPADGLALFVQDLVPGTVEMPGAAAGDTLYVMVSDMDRNSDVTTPQSITATVSVAGGDTVTGVVLTETGPDTGAFTGALTTALSESFDPSNAVLEALSGQTVTVTYNDLVAADLSPNVQRTDTLVLYSPSVTVAKTVSPGSVRPGGTVTYTVTITNSGPGGAVVKSVVDALPAGFTYISGSTTGSATGFTDSDPAISGQDLTWDGTWTVPKRAGSNDGVISFSFQADAATPSGTYYNAVSVTTVTAGTAATGDTAPVTVLAMPRISIIKSVDKSSAAPGEELIYTVYYHNAGDGDAYNLVIIDNVPPNTTYVSGSLRVGDAASTYDTATPKTDAADADEGEAGGGSIVFRINMVPGDDGVADSGSDEGKVYLKLKIDS